jgi:hypothetical protein
MLQLSELRISARLLGMSALCLPHLPVTGQIRPAPGGSGLQVPAMPIFPRRLDQGPAAVYLSEQDRAGSTSGVRKRDRHQFGLAL